MTERGLEQGNVKPEGSRALPADMALSWLGRRLVWTRGHPTEPQKLDTPHWGQDLTWAVGWGQTMQVFHPAAQVWPACLPGLWSSNVVASPWVWTLRGPASIHQPPREQLQTVAHAGNPATAMPSSLHAARPRTSPPFEIRLITVKLPGSSHWCHC